MNRQQNKQEWSRLRWENYAFYEKELAPLAATTRVLDVGSGDAPFADLLDRFKVTRIDFQAFEGIDVVTDLTKPLPFSDASYDVVFASNVFEHLPHVDRVVQECRRVLVGGGVLYATIPFMLGVHQRPYDFGRYTDIYLKQMLTEAGFSDIEIVPLGPPSDVIEASIRKIVGMWYARGGFGYMVARVAGWSVRMIMRALPDLPPDPDLTTGYGIIARVPSS